MPPMLLPAVAIGAVVGLLVGLTGLGGGILLLPLLIFGLGVPPMVAVGSDLAVAACTKAGAAILHARQRTVDWWLVRWLALGSLPGAVAGVALLERLHDAYGAGVNDILVRLLGALLLVIPLLLIAQAVLERRAAFSLRALVPAWITPRAGAVVTGVVGGVLVGLTAMGSGSVIMMMMLLFFSRRPAVLVGTDVVHALLLTALSALLHARLGTVDVALAASVVLGSVPAALVGARLSPWLPAPWLRGLLIALLFATGFKML